ncbi:helix-turn-helix domain-containing protein [Actinosynnema sp. NPDC020468]|uniref:TetR/AcrR family transcriptional regulator n=1 Tax=Actinosynnema sp. NPDC020468 TaxID=3154488 RepID=UPI0033C39954
MSAAGAGRRPMRSDARRNRATLVEVARKVFAEHGADASLEEIARQSGVGIGTLYRHFPTRETLLDAVVRDRVAALSDNATRQLGGSDPAEALLGWLREVIRHAATYRGLTAALMVHLHDTDPLYETCLTMHKTAAELLSRAQRAGAVRAGVDATDLFGVVNAIGWLAEHTPDREDGVDRALDIVVNGLRGR